MNSKPQTPDHRFCVAPMMNHTDRDFRYLLRLISRHVMLYTEMITSGAILHGGLIHRLEFDRREHPLGIQLAGNDPAELARCARLAGNMGYDEINLNIGCPSGKVQRARFGACLMAEPGLVAECVAAIKDEILVPVTIKTRIGIDNRDSYDHLCYFIQSVSDSGCRTLILHARKAWLEGLSPKQNREVPPLDYDKVYRVKQDFPDLEIIINGGITTLEQAQRQLQRVDGVMMGRAVCSNPYLLAGADRLLFNDSNPIPSRRDILRQFMDYAEGRLTQGTSLHRLTRHILGLFQGQPGARAWRRFLSENTLYRNCKDIRVIEEAMHHVRAA